MLRVSWRVNMAGQILKRGRVLTWNYRRCNATLENPKIRPMSRVILTHFSEPFLPRACPAPEENKMKGIWSTEESGTSESSIFISSIWERETKRRKGKEQSEKVYPIIHLAKNFPVCLDKKHTQKPTELQRVREWAIQQNSSFPCSQQQGKQKMPCSCTA